MNQKATVDHLKERIQDSSRQHALLCIQNDIKTCYGVQQLIDRFVNTLTYRTNIVPEFTASQSAAVSAYTKSQLVILFVHLSLQG